MCSKKVNADVYHTETEFEIPYLRLERFTFIAETTFTTS